MMEWIDVSSSPEPAIKVHVMNADMKVEFRPSEVRFLYGDEFCFEFTCEEFSEFPSIFLLRVNNCWCDIHVDIGENYIDYWAEEEDEEMTISNHTEAILCLNSAEILLIKSHVHELYDLNRDI